MERCAKCGETIPADSPGGECPKCLLAAGLGAEGSDLDLGPYSLEELAEAFPQLSILEFLGQGGMGVVYLARQKSLDRPVALKVLSREVGEDPRFAERFDREAKALARLSHPNIVGVHEAGRAGDLFFLMMEYVDGTNLREALGDGRLTPEEALAIVPQICDALQFAHDRGVVHRDVKPENILLDREGNVKIADFGLAKMLNRSPGDLSLTGTDQVMGTLHYIAPEQMKEPKGVDHRADIYSLGVVFYEMLTGELPVGRFPPPSERVQVDVRLDEVVLRALEREREQRYQRVDEIKSGVTVITSSAPRPSPATPTPPPPRSETAPSADRRLSRLAVLGALGLPIALLLIFAGAMSGTMKAALILGAVPAVLVLFTGVILSAVAWSRISANPDRLSGRWLAIPGVVLPVVLGIFGLPLAVGLLYFVRVESEYGEIELAYLNAETTALIVQLDDVAGGMTDLEGVAELIDPAQRDWFLSLPNPEFKRLFDAGELGFAMFDDGPGRISAFEIETCHVTGDDAWITVTRDTERVRFPLVRRNGGWYFAIGKVERLPEDE